jgi:hypothetical protein
MLFKRGVVRNENILRTSALEQQRPEFLNCRSLGNIFFKNVMHCLDLGRNGPDGLGEGLPSASHGQRIGIDVDIGQFDHFGPCVFGHACRFVVDHAQSPHFACHQSLLTICRFARKPIDTMRAAPFLSGYLTCAKWFPVANSAEKGVESVSFDKTVF